VKWERPTSTVTQSENESSASLRPENFGCGQREPPSRLKMNSLRSALTAALVGLKDP